MPCRHRGPVDSKTHQTESWIHNSVLTILRYFNGIIKREPQVFETAARWNNKNFSTFSNCNEWGRSRETFNPGILVNGETAILYINIPRDFHEHRDQDHEHHDILHILSKSSTYYLRISLLYFFYTFKEFWIATIFEEESIVHVNLRAHK
jgi:hypothetical protein